MSIERFHLLSQILLLLGGGLSVICGILLVGFAARYRRPYAKSLAIVYGLITAYLCLTVVVVLSSSLPLLLAWVLMDWLISVFAVQAAFEVCLGRGLPRRLLVGLIGGLVCLLPISAALGPLSPQGHLLRLCVNTPFLLTMLGSTLYFWSRRPRYERGLLVAASAIWLSGVLISAGPWSPSWEEIASNICVLLSTVLFPIGYLSHLFDTIAFELSQENDRVQAERSRVERLVDERTAELATANAHLEATLDELRQQDRHKDEFFSVVSHELRTPVASIMGFGEFLEDRLAGELTPGQEEFVGGILSATRQLALLVDDLLDVARIAGGTLRLEPRLTSLNDLLAQAIAIATPLVDHKRQSLQVAIASDLPAIHGDPQRLIQVVLNLLSNASKFSPEGSEIALRAERDPEGVVVEVRDRGIGIDVKEHAAVFERFYQSDRSLTRRRGGVGLGLAIARELIALHGGRITLDSAFGKGATFRIHLPAAEASNPQRV